MKSHILTKIIIMTKPVVVMLESVVHYNPHILAKIKPVVVKLECPHTVIAPSVESPQSLPRSPVIVGIHILSLIAIVILLILSVARQGK